VIRTLHPELLDTLPADDASAIGSRRDLRRLNNLMGHARIIARSLKQIFPQQPPSRILEIGAGDGQLLLRVARRLRGWIKLQRSRDLESTTQFLPLPQGEGRGEGEGRSVTTVVSTAQPRSSAPQVDVLFIDLQNLLSEDTKIEFAILNWGVRCVEADIFDWLSDPSAQTDVVLANLVLHHFTDAQLTLLFAEAAEKADAFIAVEPRRSRWPLFCARLLGLIGCNAVTRHDAPISVRAGFTGRELSALWPRNGEWELTECRAGLFSHLFVARRKG
jgi:SAM-dependent methyltransferase